MDRFEGENKMYHCQINFYFTGIPCQAFEQIKTAAPLAHFTHTFSQSRELDAALLAHADAVFANLDGMDEEGRCACCLRKNVRMRRSLCWQTAARRIGPARI